MGINKVANQDDVLYRSGGPLKYNFNHEAAAHTSPTTTGTASITYESNGVLLDVGSATGENATLALESLSQFREGVFERQITFQTWGGTPPLDTTYRLGYGVEPGVDRHAYLDFEAGVYSVGDAAGTATTKQATLPDSYRGCYLTITVDTQAGETTFTQRGSVNETVTINTTERVSGTLIYAESNGTAESLPRVGKATSNYIPKQ